MTTQTIEPFWQRLPAIARYPLREGALFTIIALVVTSLLEYMPGMMGMLVAIVLWVAGYKYAFEILRHTANGHLDPPEQALGSDNREVWNYLLLLVVGWLVMLAVFRWLGPVPGYAVMALLLFVQPVALMSLGMDGGIAAAINPATWGAVISRIGPAYLALVALLFVFQASASNAAGLLGAIMPSFVSGLIAYAFALWGLFATFHLMGYMIFQYHEALGFDPSARVGGADLPADRDQELIDAASLMVQDGETDAAIAQLQGHIRSRSVSPAVHQLYRRLLMSSNDVPALLRHGRDFIGQLLAENNERAALVVVRESLDADPGFVPPLCEHATRLAAAAERMGQSALAVQLNEAAFRGFPKESAAIDAGIRAARLMSDRQGRDDDARTLLQEARQRTTDVEQSKQIDAALQLLDSVAG